MRMKVKKTTYKNIPMIVLKPTKKEPKACLLWIHGGGYITGMASMVFMSRAKNLVDKFGIIVVSPEYRIQPYPIPLEDCYVGLQYLRTFQKPIMVGGESAGGGLCIALCLYARDKGETDIQFQLPLYPMMADRDTPSSKDNHAPVWNTKWNHRGWGYYLKNINGEIPKYASPAREIDYSNLPPAYTFVGDIEPFYCETLTYINNLQKNDIPAKVDIYPNCFHAFDMLLPFKKVSKKAIQKFELEFEKALNNIIE